MKKVANNFFKAPKDVIEQKKKKSDKKSDVFCFFVIFLRKSYAIFFLKTILKR